MGRADYWKPGDPNAICDVCGFKYKLSQLRKRWDGLMCCPQDWNIRQPQDFVRGVRDQRPIPMARPEAPIVVAADASGYAARQNVVLMYYYAQEYYSVDQYATFEEGASFNYTFDGYAVSGYSNDFDPLPINQWQNYAQAWYASPIGVGYA